MYLCTDVRSFFFFEEQRKRNVQFIDGIKLYNAVRSGKAFWLRAIFQSFEKIMDATKIPSHTLRILKSEGAVAHETAIGRDFPYLSASLRTSVKYPRLEREGGYGSGVMISMEDEEENGHGHTCYIIDDIHPIPNLVNTISARLAMQNFLQGVRERPFHPYGFTHPLFEGT